MSLFVRYVYCKLFQREFVIPRRDGDLVLIAVLYQKAGGGWNDEA